MHDAEYDVLLNPYKFSDFCESALTPQEIQTRRKRTCQLKQKSRQWPKM
jgi:hypothetical protein